MHKDQFKNNPLFILATGPSLLEEDLRPLATAYTWGVGHLIDWPDLPFTPNFYGCGEFSTLWDLRDRLEGLDTIRFYADDRHLLKESSSNDLRRKVNEFGLDESKWWTVPMKAVPDEKGMTNIPGLRVVEVHDGFIPDDLRYVSVEYKASLLHSALQPAVWLGFSPIYLLGFDLTDTGYAYDPDSSRGVLNPYVDDGLVHKALNVVREWCEAKGVRVVNLSQGTTETVLEKDSLQNVLGVPALT